MKNDMETPPNWWGTIFRTASKVAGKLIQTINNFKTAQYTYQEDGCITEFYYSPESNLGTLAFYKEKQTNKEGNTTTAYKVLNRNPNQETTLKRPATNVSPSQEFVFQKGMTRSATLNCMEKNNLPLDTNYEVEFLEDTTGGDANGLESILTLMLDSLKVSSSEGLTVKGLKFSISKEGLRIVAVGAVAFSLIGFMKYRLGSSRKMTPRGNGDENVLRIEGENRTPNTNSNTLDQRRWLIIPIDWESNGVDINDTSSSLAFDVDVCLLINYNKGAKREFAGEELSSAEQAFYDNCINIKG